MRSRVLALLAALFLVIGLAACGSDSDDDAKATTTTAADKATTTTAADKVTTTSDASGSDDGSTTTSAVSIPTEKPNADFCEGYKFIDEADNPPDDLPGIKSFYTDAQGAIEQMHDNAPDELKSSLAETADVLGQANKIIQAASSKTDLENSQELESIFSKDISLEAVEAYGKKYCS